MEKYIPGRAVCAGQRSYLCAQQGSGFLESAAGVGKDKVAKPDSDLQCPLLFRLLEMFGPQTFLWKTDYKDLKKKKKHLGDHFFTLPGLFEHPRPSPHRARI